MTELIILISRVWRVLDMKIAPSSAQTHHNPNLNTRHSSAAVPGTVRMRVAIATNSHDWTEIRNRVRNVCPRHHGWGHGKFHCPPRSPDWPVSALRSVCLLVFCAVNHAPPLIGWSASVGRSLVCSWATVGKRYCPVQNPVPPKRIYSFICTHRFNLT